MSKFPVLSVYRGIYVLIGWAIILGGLYLAYETSKIGNPYGNNYGNQQINPTIFIAIAGIAAFFGATMIIVGESLNLLLRIEDHLDAIRRSHETQPRFPVNTTSTQPLNENLDLEPFPDD